MIDYVKKLYALVVENWKPAGLGAVAGFIVPKLLGL